MPLATPDNFADLSDAEQLRFLKNQYAEAASAKEVTDGRKRVTRQDLPALEAAIKRLEEKIRGSSRLKTIPTRHVRRT